MKKKNLLLTTITIAILGFATIASAQNSQIKSNSKGFYIINVAAVKTESEAKTKVTSLINEGYSASYLWIPDYASLSGAKYFSVYIGPFYSQHDCEVATSEYRKKIQVLMVFLYHQPIKKLELMGLGRL